jgi:hypothetical protein
MNSKSSKTARPDEWMDWPHGHLAKIIHFRTFLRAFRHNMRANPIVEMPFKLAFFMNVLFLTYGFVMGFLAKLWW